MTSICMRGAIFGAGLVAALPLLVGAPHALARQGVEAQPKAPEQKPPTLTLEELLRLIEEQKKTIEEQRAMLEQLMKLLETQATNLEARGKEIEALKLQIESMTRRLDELQSELPALEAQRALEERLKRVEEAAQKAPELPPDVVSAGDFPGSIRIPGTDAAIKFGGRVRVAVVATLDPLGSGDRFLTNSIPVDSIVDLPDQQTNINANTSRLNFELRTPTGAGQMRAFIEADFFGDGNTFRMRHAYAQFRGIIFGQTWSTFSDPAATHEDLDFEGVSSENLTRQPQIRYTWILKERFTLAAAIETPEVSVTGGIGSDVVPDLVGQFRWKFKEIGHLQVAAVGREIRAAPLSDPDDFERKAGWGLGLSGVLPFYRWNLTDRFVFQVNGGVGIARYINDLDDLGGQDGAFDPVTGDFEALPAFGWYLDYEHMWKRWQRIRDMNLRSSIIWSVVKVNTADFQPDDAYKLTHRLGVNVIYSPIQRIDMGLEYIYGSRENKNGAKGQAEQVQVVMLFRF